MIAFIIWGLWVWGDWEGVALRLLFFFFFFDISQKFEILHFFYSKRASSPAGNEVETQKTENRPTYGDFGIWLPESPTSPNFKTHKRIILHNRNYIACKVYTYPITYLSFIKI